MSLSLTQAMNWDEGSSSPELRRLQRRTIATSMLVYGEVIEYFKGLPNFPAHYATFHKVLAEIPPYPLTYRILERYADIRRTLRPLHQDIGDIDTLIAAMTIEQNLMLVT